jgi:D-3-phosphoglycerate dehydrogenase
MKKIYFIDTVHSVLEEKLTEAGYDCFDLTKEKKENISPLVCDAYGLVIRSRITLSREFLKNIENLHFIARSGSGLENIDLEYCKKHQIEVYNSPEGNKDAVAEHCLGLLFALMNNFKPAQKDLTNSVWDREKNRGSELSAQKVAIIGYGHNGSAFAQRLSALGAKVLVYDKFKSGFSSEGIKECSLEEVFLRATAISFHVPLTPETAYLADYQFFKRFRHPVYVLNISRGGILKTKALIQAIDEGAVIGAGLDVLEEESKSFDVDQANKTIIELNQRPNIVLTPHVAGWTKESYYKLSFVLAQKVLNQKSPQ